MAAKPKRGRADRARRAAAEDVGARGRAAAGAHPYFVTPEHTRARARDPRQGQDPRARAEGAALHRRREGPRHRARRDEDLRRAAQLPEQPEVARLRRLRLRRRHQRPARRRDRRLGRREARSASASRRTTTPAPITSASSRSSPTARRGRTRRCSSCSRPRRTEQCAAARRKFWGWGYEDAGPSAEQELGIGRTLAARFGTAPSCVAPRRGSTRSRCARRACAARGAARASARARPTTAPRPHLRQVVPRRRARAAPRLPAPRPTWSRFRATKRDVAALLDWCASAASRHSVRRRLERRRRRRGARPRRLRAASCRSTSAARSRARDRPRLARRAHPGAACSAPRSRTSCGRTGSRCATSRSRSSSRRSAAGSRRARAATTRRSTRTSTTSSSRCAW